MIGTVTYVCTRTYLLHFAACCLRMVYACWCFGFVNNCLNSYCDIVNFVVWHPVAALGNFNGGARASSDLGSQVSRSVRPWWPFLVAVRNYYHQNSTFHTSMGKSPPFTTQQYILNTCYVWSLKKTGGRDSTGGHWPTSPHSRWSRHWRHGVFLAELSCPIHRHVQFCSLRCALKLNGMATWSVS
jgi:hypothetical protein